MLLLRCGGDQAQCYLFVVVWARPTPLRKVFTGDIAYGPSSIRAAFQFFQNRENTGRLVRLEAKSPHRIDDSAGCLRGHFCGTGEEARHGRSRN